MGWRCRYCGNTEHFEEINRVSTSVFQEKYTTKVVKRLSRYMQDPLVEIKCAQCKSMNVEWMDVPDQKDDYKYEQDGYVTEDQSINTIVFELTNKCDLDCVYCPKNGNEELNFSIIQRLVQEDLELENPIRHFELGWDMGNPLLHSKISDIIGMFNNSSCKVNILTNGKDFVNRAKELNMSNLTFTFFLDHPEEEENDRLMSKGVFAGTIDAFKFLKRRSVEFNIYMRLNSRNYGKIEDMHKLANEHGAKMLIPTEIYPLGKAEQDYLMTDEMKQEAIHVIERLKLNKSIHFSPALSNANCTYQRKMRLFINAKGKLAFCHFLSMANTAIVDVDDKHILELVQINNKVRNNFMKEKDSLFGKWEKPRQTSSPCSYCIHSFGLDIEW